MGRQYYFEPFWRWDLLGEVGAGRPNKPPRWGTGRFSSNQRLRLGWAEMN